MTVIAPQGERANRRNGGLGRDRSALSASTRLGDLAGQFLVVAATDVPEVNRAVFAEAEAAGILINAVDDPPFCDFYFPSVVRRGDLQIAISTAGESPALAQRLRKEINALLPLDTGDWLAELGNLRREVLQLEPLNDARKALLHQLASREVCGYDAMPFAHRWPASHALTDPRPHPESDETKRDSLSPGGRGLSRRRRAG